MKIGLIGAGRLGSCLALLIEQEGYHVIASDVREDYVKDLQNKKSNSTSSRTLRAFYKFRIYYRQ